LVKEEKVDKLIPSHVSELRSPAGARKRHDKTHQLKAGLLPVFEED
jgi:hypothetical protein